MKTIEDAIITATLFHAGHVNGKDNSPYIYHPLHVMDQMELDDLDGRKVAVLHDAVEDTACTLDHLRHLGFAEHIIEAIDAITWRKGEPLEEYLIRVKYNTITTRVKIQDAIHNLERSTKSLAENVGDLKKMKKIQARIDKYTMVLEYLK